MDSRHLTTMVATLLLQRYYCHDTLSVFMALCKGKPLSARWISPQKQQYKAFIFAMLLAWTSRWTNCRLADDWRRNKAYVIIKTHTDLIDNAATNKWLVVNMIGSVASVLGTGSSTTSFTNSFQAHNPNIVKYELQSCENVQLRCRDIIIHRTWLNHWYTKNNKGTCIFQTI